MTTKEYVEAFEKALNSYIKKEHNQDECKGFIDDFNKGSETKQLILSGVINRFIKDLEKKHNIDIDREHLSIQIDNSLKGIKILKWNSLSDVPEVIEVINGL